MSALRIGVAASAALALSPITVFAAPGTSDQELRAALSEPVQGGFVEVVPGTPNTLAGRFDAAQYGDSFASSDRSGVARALTEAGFAAGYDRDWDEPQTERKLGELVMVFTGAGGAKQIADSSRGSYEHDSGFREYVDMTGIPGAYALHIDRPGFLWTVVVFEKGNAMYALSAGGPGDSQQTLALDQAAKVYADAPASFRITVASEHIAGIDMLSLPNAAQILRVMAFGVFAAALISGAVLAILVYVIFRPRSNAAVAKVSQQ